MLFRLLLLFTVVPLIELAILIKIGQRIGVVETIVLIILAGVAGAVLVKLEGLRVIAALRSDLAARRLPHDRLIDALLVLIAAVMLIFPGVLSDICAIVLLLPPTRKIVRRFVKNRFRQKFTLIRNFRQPPDDQNLIDV